MEFPCFSACLQEVRCWKSQGLHRPRACAADPKDGQGKEAGSCQAAGLGMAGQGDMADGCGNSETAPFRNHD